MATRGIFMGILYRRKIFQVSYTEHPFRLATIHWLPWCWERMADVKKDWSMTLWICIFLCRYAQPATIPRMLWDKNLKTLNLNARSWKLLGGAARGVAYLARESEGWSWGCLKYFCFFSQFLSRSYVRYIQDFHFQIFISDLLLVQTSNVKTLKTVWWKARLILEL